MSAAVDRPSYPLPSSSVSQPLSPYQELNRLDKAVFSLLASAQARRATTNLYKHMSSYTYSGCSSQPSPLDGARDSSSGNLRGCTCRLRRFQRTARASKASYSPCPRVRLTLPKPASSELMSTGLSPYALVFQLLSESRATPALRFSIGLQSPALLQMVSSSSCS